MDLVGLVCENGVHLRMISYYLKPGQQWIKVGAGLLCGCSTIANYQHHLSQESHQHQHIIILIANQKMRGLIVLAQYPPSLFMKRLFV